jgi:signal transduction histidine kinase/uncharacterized protein HemY
MNRQSPPIIFFLAVLVSISACNRNSPSDELGRSLEKQALHPDFQKADTILAQLKGSQNRKKNVSLLMTHAEIMMDHREYLTAQHDLKEVLKQARDAGFSEFIPGILLNTGKLEKELNHFASAESLFNQALSGFRELADTAGIAAYYSQMGSLEWKKDSLPKAEEFFLKSVRYYNSAGDSSEKIHVLINLGFICREQNKPEKAEAYYLEALKLSESLKDIESTATCLHHLGGHYQKKKDFTTAIDFYTRALDLRKKNNDYEGAGQSWLNMAIVYRDLGAQEMAMIAFDSSIAQAEKSANNIFLSSVLSQAGNLHLRAGHFVMAHDLFLRSLDSCSGTGDLLSISQAYSNLGSLFKQIQNPDMGLEYYNKATRLLESSEKKRKLPFYLNEMGNIYFDKDAADSALNCYTLSLSEAEKFHDYREIAIANKNIGRSWAKLGNNDKAMDYLLKAESIYRSENDLPGLLETLNEKGNALQAADNYNEALAVFAEIIKITTAGGDKIRLSQGLRKTAEIRIKTGQTEGLDELLQQALTLTQALNNPALVRNVIYTQYLYYKKLGNNASALKCLEDYQLISDSLARINLDKEVLLKQTGYEISLSESMRHSAEHKMALQQQLIDRQRLTLVLFIIAFLLFAGTLLLLYNRYLLKRKTARLVSEKYEITERTNQQLRESEESLKKINHTKDKFFSIIAHDIRSPLTGLIAFTDLVNKQGKDLSHAELIGINRQLNEASRNLFGLLDNLLHWAKTQTGNVPFYPEPVNIHDLVESCSSLNSAQAANKNIQVIQKVPEGLNCLADRNMVMLILRNLLSNAIKFTPEGGRIEITGSAGNSSCQLIIADTGVGMNEDTLSRLFRLDAHMSTRGTANEAGSGLGLILCKEFAEKNGGTIYAESTPGTGSRFIFTLPAIIENK